jgi:hypothetical protein
MLKHRQSRLALDSHVLVVYCEQKTYVTLIATLEGGAFTLDVSVHI